MTFMCRKKQPHHSQPDPQCSGPPDSWLPAWPWWLPCWQSSGYVFQLELCSGKTNGAVLPLFKGALCLPSSTPHRKPLL